MHVSKLYTHCSGGEGKISMLGKSVAKTLPWQGRQISMLPKFVAKTLPWWGRQNKHVTKVSCKDPALARKAK